MIHQHYFPEMSGTARRTKELAESFVKRGHEVSVVTSFPREYRSMPGEEYKPFEIIGPITDLFSLIKVVRTLGLFSIIFVSK